MAFDHGKAFQAFRQVTKCLDANFAHKYFLIDGTLLGFARNGGFIPGDYDIDFGMWIEDFSPQILEDFKNAGFVYCKTLGTVGSGLHLKFKVNNVRIDLVFYYREEGRIWNMVYPTLARYKAIYPEFELQPVVFKGIEVMAPSPPEIYLKAVYGPEWKRPVQRWNYKYLCHNYESQSGPVINAIYRLREKLWRWKNPDPFLKRDGTKLRTVYTDGVFDLFHANHALFLEEARAHGDLLIVGVVSDQMAEGYKRQPTISEQERLRVIQSHKSVDISFILDGPVVARTLDKIIADYNVDAVVYAGDNAEAFGDYFGSAINGGFFYKLPYHDGTSTSKIIKCLNEQI